MRLTHCKLQYTLGASLALALLCARPVRADYASTILAQKPVGYWRLNETTLPQPLASALNQGSLGASEDGAYNNYPVRGVPGPFNGSVGVNFDGVSQSVMAPYSPAINPNAFTIEAWLRPDTATPPGNLTCVLASMYSAPPREGWLIYQSGGSPDSTAPGWQLRLYDTNGLATSLQLLVTNNVVPGTWYDVVFTFDGTTAKGYLNGQFANSGIPTGFVTNSDPSSPFSIGVRSDTGFYWAGGAAEVAYYGAALTDAQVKAHFDAATTNPAGYASQIIGDAPLLYYRFQEPPDALAANLGTLGASANGVYLGTSAPGQAGPQPPAYPGFEAGNHAVGFDGSGAGHVNLGALNLDTNTVTITAWVKPNGQQAPYAGIVFNRTATTTAAGLAIDAAGGLDVAYDWNDDNATYNWPSYLTMSDSDWSFVGLVVQPDQASMYLANGANVSTFTSATNYVPHANQPFESWTWIGGDPGFQGSYFNGDVDEVAIFDRPLSAGELYTEYAAAVGGVAPKIFLDPALSVSSLYAGDTVTLNVDAGGTPALSYQWRKDGSPISGATTNVLTLAGLTTQDSGNYDVVVSNPVGAATSQPATLSVNPAATPLVDQPPAGRTLYPGATLNLSVVAEGGALQYQWQKDGADIAGATDSSYVVDSVTPNDGGNYQVVISDSAGSTTAGPVSITVVAPAAGSFDEAIVDDGPEAWWRLDDPPNSTTMLDAMGRHDGYYTNISGSPVTLGVPGAIPNSTNTAMSVDGASASFGVVPYFPALSDSEFTLECWVKTSVLGNYNLVPVSNRYGGTSSTSSPYGAKGCWFWTYPRGQWSAGVSGGVLDQSGIDQSGSDFYVPLSTPGDNIVSNGWSQLVLTYSFADGLRVYVNGQTDGQEWGDFDRNGAGPLLIGARGVSHGTPADDLFEGEIDEVAFYTHELTPDQIQNHYQMALYGTDTKPVFKKQPQSQTVSIGAPASFSAAVEGTLPITLQWFKDGTPLAGETNATLDLPTTDYADTGNYTLVASNSAGSSTTAVAALAVLPPMLFANVTNGLVLHLKFDGNYLDSSGRANNGTPEGSPTFVPGKIGTEALYYSTDVTNLVYNYVTLGSPADLAFSSNVSFSISYWIRLPTGYVLGDLPIFCSAAKSYGNDGITIAPSYDAGGWSWSLGDGNDYWGLYGPDNSINDGQWHHLIHTFDRAAMVGTTYLDGVKVDATTLAGLGDIDTPGPFNIGQDPTGTYGESGAADLDDLGIWRRVLTPDEAYAIYQAGANAGASFDTYGPERLAAVHSGSDLLLIWQAGTLLESDSLNGPWTPVSGATAPSYRVPLGTGPKYYRVKL
jgi:Concanavalin A-like lectin/glucanases superfamily/Immunoglobulin I-set domain/Immunoglobulin domain